MKGLFCAVDKQTALSLCVHGLGAHPSDAGARGEGREGGTVFEESWFALHPPPLPLLPPSCASGLRDNGFAQAAAATSSDAAPRFSRFSTDASQGERFLVLCRVLLAQVLSVSGEITAADVQQALAGDCDCVHSAST